MSTNGFYSICVGDYAHKHFIKNFEKKYKSAWRTTWIAIEFLIQRIDNFQRTSKAEIIHSCSIGHIVKCEFSVAGTNESPHASGNRYIVFQNEELKTCTILLLYGKIDIGGNNETSWWQKEIRNNYPEITKLFTGL